MYSLRLSPPAAVFFLSIFRNTSFSSPEKYKLLII